MTEIKDMTEGELIYEIKQAATEDYANKVSYDRTTAEEIELLSRLSFLRQWVKELEDKSDDLCRKYYDLSDAVNHEISDNDELCSPTP